MGYKTVNTPRKTGRTLAEVYFETMMNLMDEYPNVMELEADLAACILGGGYREMKEQYPKQLINCGIEEANMIGVAKSIIAVQVGKQNVAMLNPQIVKHSAEYSEVMEGCLSLLGERPAKRYEWIEVEYKDIRFKPQKQRFSGFTAQIIQHEIDHCQGILI